MKTLLVLASLMLLAFVPSASATAGGCTLPPVSQWDVCVENGCVIVHGPAIVIPVCPGVMTPGCEEGELGACTYQSGSSTCVRVQIGYHHIERCVSRNIATA
jgi:hypothetical protein